MTPMTDLHRWHGASIGRASEGLQALRRPSIWLLGAAVMGVVANAMAVAAPAQPAPASAPKTRLGASLQDSMAARDRQLAEEKRKLDMREQAARAIEARLAGDADARQGQGGSVPRAGAAAAEPNQPYDDLARIYQTMKPARAAPIFEKLDLTVQTEVAKRMRERSAALLMAAMNPNAAAELTMSLAGRRVVPSRPQPAARALSGPPPAARKAPAAAAAATRKAADPAKAAAEKAK